MKKSINATLIILLVLLVSLISFSGCAAPGASAITADLILTAVQDVAPSFSTTASRAATWALGSPIYELYGVLKDDGEPVGYFNLYGLMGSADNYFTALSTDSTAITLQEVSPPTGVELGFAAADQQYNLYREYVSEENSVKTYGRVDGTIFYMLVAMQRTATGENSKQVIQGKYDSSTGVLDIRLFYANEVGTVWEKGYAFVSGDDDDHQFTMKIIRDGTAYDHNMVGYGISQGAGYFLMKLANESMVMTGAKYYEFNAESLGLTALQAMDDAGSATVPANTTAYGTTIEGITPLEADSLPTEAELDALNVFTGVSHS
ncbi:MAG: hypothetical protein JEZ04_12575 [Spirochaetales bacterium]|nr:hypothetical protein [Spirochaetales bacterium]